MVLNKYPLFPIITNNNKDLFIPLNLLDSKEVIHNNFKLEYSALKTPIETNLLTLTENEDLINSQLVSKSDCIDINSLEINYLYFSIGLGSNQKLISFFIGDIVDKAFKELRSDYYQLTQGILINLDYELSKIAHYQLVNADVISKLNPSLFEDNSLNILVHLDFLINKVTGHLSVKTRSSFMIHGYPQVSHKVKIKLGDIIKFRHHPEWLNKVLKLYMESFTIVGVNFKGYRHPCEKSIISNFTSAMRRVFIGCCR